MGGEASGEDRGGIERRLIEEAEYPREIYPAADLLREAADAIGSARWAIGQALRQVAGMAPAVDSDAPSGGLADQCDCVRVLLSYALESLKGGG